MKRILSVFKQGRWLRFLAGLWIVGAGGARVGAVEPAPVPATGDVPSVVLVVGAPGESNYQTNFLQQATAWGNAVERAAARHQVFDGGNGAQTNQWQLLKSTLAAEPKLGTAPFWLVLIGHGTFNGKEARMNLVGPDVTAMQLAEWLRPFQRPVVVVNSTSSSAPFLNALSRTNRVVITSTRSGFEQNYARFGEYLARSVGAREADLDQDGQTSLLEAFLHASAQVAEFYKTEGRLLTEHALIDDNGDALGTPAEWFRGVRSTKTAKGGASLDGVRAHQMHLVRSDADLALSPEQRARRDALELVIARLRDTKSKVPADEYYGQLETLLLELARLYEVKAAAAADVTLP